jgi:hypothetical protein
LSHIYLLTFKKSVQVIVLRKLQDELPKPKAPKRSSDPTVEESISKVGRASSWKVMHRRRITPICLWQMPQAASPLQPFLS